jgi:hypothetical protein
MEQKGVKRKFVTFESDHLAPVPMDVLMNEFKELNKKTFSSFEIIKEQYEAIVKKININNSLHMLDQREKITYLQDQNNQLRSKVASLERQIEEYNQWERPLDLSIDFESLFDS